MAILLKNNTGQKLVLHSYHTFGRGNTVDTRITKPTISLLHASIRWLDTHWDIINHGRNGTWVNTHHLASGENLKLNRGDTIRFANDDASIWVFNQDNPPSTSLISFPDADQIIHLHDFHGLPSDESPIVSVYLSAQGIWVYEQDDLTVPLNDKDFICYGDHKWHFHNPQNIAPTCYVPESELEENIQIRALFQVSRDEEHVSLKLQVNEKNFDLSERTHHYLMLLLARQKISDAEADLAPEAQGWISIERLPDMLGVDRNHINILIFRSRKQISQELGEEYTGFPIIERELGSIRVEWNHIQINQGSNSSHLN